MSNNPDVSKIPARSYTNPLGCFGFMLLGAALIAGPFVLSAYLKQDLVWWMYAAGIASGIIALVAANNRRKGLVVDPGADKISYGFSSVPLSEVESCSTNVTTKASNGNVSQKWYLVVTGPFGSRRFPVKDHDQAQAAQTFIGQVCRLR